MPFKKGKSGNDAGRIPGSKNKKTEQWEAFADYCMNGGLEKYKRELDSLKGEKFVNAFANLLEFHKPKLARSQVELDVSENTITIVKKIIHATNKP